MENTNDWKERWRGKFPHGIQSAGQMILAEELIKSFIEAERTKAIEGVCWRCGKYRGTSVHTCKLDNHIKALIDTERTKAVEEDREMLAKEIESKTISVFDIQQIAEQSGKSGDIDFNIGGNAGLRRAADLIRNHSKKV